jgi:hypothetical protein
VKRYRNIIETEGEGSTRCLYKQSAHLLVAPKRPATETSISETPLTVTFGTRT